MNANINKSCINCPSFLNKDDARRKFKKSVGAPMCGRFGLVLGKPGSTPAQQDKLYRHFAAECTGYGQPLPPEPLENSFLVVMPDLEARTKVVAAVQREACTTCANCTNFVRDDVVAEELGWTVGLCAAKGKLILPNRQVYEARNCEFREFGAIRQSTDGLMLLPEYEAAFSSAVDPIKAFFANRDKHIEPGDWPTDREVTEEQREAGIKSWREIPDPNGTGRSAFLPIYDIESFNDVERAKIPRTGDDEHPELYVDHFGGVYMAAVTWTELDETPAAWGESGTGKTELFRHLAWLMCIPFHRISITAQTELDDLAGKMRYTPDVGTFFAYGRLPKAWTSPCVLCLDEPNTGAPEVWQWLRPLTDNSKQLVLDMNDGELLTRHEDCYLGMAMNPAWDVKNVGATQIGDADANRLFHIYVEIPPPALEREIIASRVRLDGWEIGDPALDMVMAIATDLRGLIKDGLLPISWALRPQIKVARALRWFDPIVAYRRAIGDYLEPEAQAALLDVVRAHAS